MMSKSINIVIADDHKLTCESLGALLKTLPFVNHIHLAHNGEEALAFVRHHPIDVALLDVRMPVMDGIQAAECILREHPSIKVISMTMFGNDATLLDLYRVGVHGIILKENANFTHLTLAITEVIEGRKYFNKDVILVLDHNVNQLAEPSRTHLTPRELDVLHHTCNGAVAKEIAKCLKIRVGSVENHRKEMLRKTKTKNVAELVNFAHRNGLL